MQGNFRHFEQKLGYPIQVTKRMIRPYWHHLRWIGDRAERSWVVVVLDGHRSGCSERSAC
jgi:hypothetical protein